MYCFLLYEKQCSILSSSKKYTISSTTAWACTCLHFQLLHRSLIKTVPAIINASAARRSSSSQDSDARWTFLRCRRTEPMKPTSGHCQGGWKCWVVQKRLKTHLFGLSFNLPISSWLLLRALDFGHDHAYGTLNIVQIIIIIIIISSIYMFIKWIPSTISRRGKCSGKPLHCLSGWLRIYAGKDIAFPIGLT